jgi:hypothetical protein
LAVTSNRPPPALINCDLIPNFSSIAFAKLAAWGR